MPKSGCPPIRDGRKDLAGSSSCVAAAWFPRPRPCGLRRPRLSAWPNGGRRARLGSVIILTVSSDDPSGVGAWLCVGLGAVIPLSLFVVLVRRRYRREMGHSVAVLDPRAGSSRDPQPTPYFPPPA